MEPLQTVNSEGNQTSTPVKITTSFSNFNKGNTPKLMELIGNIFLIVGTLAGIVATLPLGAPIINTAASIVTVVGVLGKLWSKLRGVNTMDDTPVIQTPTDSVIAPAHLNN